jgi:hypothetical protein
VDGDVALERWAAEARAREAADARVRERWLRAQAEEAACFAEVALRLAERDEPVVATTTGGRRHRGRIAGVGTDFVAVVADAGQTTLLALHAIADVRGAAPARRAPTAAGEGEADVGRAVRAELGVRLMDVLAQAAAARPRVSVVAGSAVVVGDLWAVGTDVLTVRPDGTAGAAYVRSPSVSEISFLASG